MFLTRSRESTDLSKDGPIWVCDSLTLFIFPIFGKFKMSKINEIEFLYSQTNSKDPNLCPLKNMKLMLSKKYIMSMPLTRSKGNTDIQRKK